jgi:O-antigen/teichoic acid export membrane protein
MVALSSASQLGFGNVLNRFLPSAGRRTGRLVQSAYCIGAVASILLSFAFIAVAPLIANDLKAVLSNWTLIAWFSLGTAAWTIFALQDSALAGMRRAAWVPLENSIYALLKLMLLVVFAGIAASGIAIFAAWTAPLIFMIVGVNFLIAQRVLPAITTAPSAELTFGRIINFFGWDYAGGLTLTLAFAVAPLLVLNHSGPAASAIYHLSWTITYSLYLIGRSMGISLLTEGVSDKSRLKSLVFDSFVYTMVPLTAAALMIAAAAPLVMRMFGESYAVDGSNVLSVLALSSIRSTVGTHLRRIRDGTGLACCTHYRAICSRQQQHRQERTPTDLPLVYGCVGGVRPRSRHIVQAPAGRCFYTGDGYAAPRHDQNQ